MRATPSLPAPLTYAVGNNLYVPLTSRCNSRTLPETRGPNFFLPAHVVSALCRVRDLEHGTHQWTHWCMYLDTQEGPHKLPAAFDRVANLPNDEEKSPKVQDLIQEITSEIKSRPNYESIVISGEGEPTLRLDDLLLLTENLLISNDFTCPPIRLTTNGLVESPDDVPEKLAKSGISGLSVALMTGDEQQYRELMHPIDYGKNPHDQVCQFIKHSVDAGLSVETTAVDRDDVQKAETERLSKSLNVIPPVRWRPFFS